MENLVEQLKRNPEVDIESPFSIEVENSTHLFQCLIRGYGSKNGMIIDANYNNISPIENVLLEMGYGFSCFDILGDTSSSDEFIRDVLIDDWGKNVL